MNIIQWRQFANFRQTVSLSGETFVFRTRWNSSRAYWTLDIFDLQLNAIITGLKITLGTELLKRYSNEALPAGSLFAFGNSERIERESMGDEVNLIYVAD